MISVITPVINGEKYIESCLNAVIDQECSDLEHIIVDGNSKDETVSIIRKYADKYSHIRWISQDDNGQSDAINKGIAMAGGEILAILNVDDYYEPNTLNRVKEIFKTLPEPAIAVGNCNVWDDTGRLQYVNRPSRLKLTDLLLGWSINPHPVNPSAYFYHASLHEIVGPYDENQHYTMDLDFLLKAVKVSNVKYVNETWGNYCLLEETKTVIDQKRGTSINRAKDLLAKHRKKLPVFQQYKVLIMYGFYEASKGIKIKTQRVNKKCKLLLTKTS